MCIDDNKNNEEKRSGEQTENTIVSNLEKDILEYKTKFKKMEGIAILCGGRMHDINNILAGVIGTAEICLFDAPEGSNLRNHLEYIIKGGKRASEMIMETLTHYRRNNPKSTL